MDSTPPAATMLVSRPSSVARRSMLYLSCNGVFGAYIGCNRVFTRCLEVCVGCTYGVYKCRTGVHRCKYGNTGV